MKRIVIVVLFSLTGITLYAQSFGLGGRIGFNVSTLVVDDVDVQETITGAIGGNAEVYAYKMFNKIFGIEGGLMLTQAGFSQETDDETSDTKLGYVALPLSVRLKFGYFTLNPGIRPAFLIKAEVDGEDVTEQATSTDFGVFVSPGVQFPNGITLNGNAYLGFTDVNSDVEQTNLNFILQFTVGYTFFRKGE